MYVIFPMSKKLKLKPWTDKHQKNYLWLYNYIKTNNYKEANENNYIETYKKYLMSIIENNKKWSDGSKEQLLFMISRYLYNIGENRYQKLYAQAGHNLTLKIKNKEEQNEQDEKEKENYREHSYFEDILNNINFEDIKTIQEHYKFLLLSLLTYQPPLRTSFYTTAKFIRAKDDNDHINNFIWINRRGKLKITIIINRDKASNYKIYNMNKNLSFIPLENEQLEQLINYSFEKFPRSYLFEINKKPITATTLLNYLRDITGIDKINIDMMRSSYINWFYSENHTMSSKTKLSHQMRHSTDTAARNYYKVVELDPVEIENKYKDAEKIIIEQQTKLKELNNKLEAYQNNKDDIKLFKKRRGDIIYNLNKKGREAKETTLKKYDIKYNNEKKIYV